MVNPFQRISLILFASVSVLVVGLVITFSISRHLHLSNQMDVNEAISKRLDLDVRAIFDRVKIYEFGLRGGRGAVITAGEHGITRSLFERYSQSRDIDKEFPGARGFGFIRRVPQESQATFLEAARGENPDFSIKELQPHEGERYVIQFIEPIVRNAQAVGLDVASEIHRRQAADSSIVTGKATLTAPITLVQSKNAGSQSFLMMLPIYRPGFPISTAQERRIATFGWSYVPLVMDEVLRDALSADRESSIVLEDVTDAGQPVQFYKIASTVFDAPVKSEQRTISVFGRQWRITLHAYPAFVTSLKQTDPSTVAIEGVVLSVLLATLTYALGFNVMRRKRLHAAESQLAAIVQGSIDGIIGKSLDGVVLSWNKGAQDLFGYSPEEAIGKTSNELIVPSFLCDEEIALLSRIKKGERIASFRTQRRRKDGVLLYVSLSVSPILDTNGQVVAASKTIRDVTHEKNIEDKLFFLNHQLEEQVAVRTKELDAARRTLRTVLDAVPSMIGYWDEQLINRVANHAYSKWFSISPETMPGMRMQDILGEDLFQANRPYIEGALRGEPQTFERDIKGSDGKVRHSLAHYLPDIEDEVVRGFYVIVHDVSELVESRVRLGEALRDNQLLLDTIINSQLLYSAADADGQITDVNEKFCVAHGYARDEILGQPHRILNSGTHTASFWNEMWQVVKAGKSWHGEICNFSRSGEKKWFNTVIAPMLGADGSGTRYIALRIDITDRKRADAELQRLNSLLRQVLTAASEVSIIATEINGMITVFNSGAERMLGYDASEMIGKCTPEVIHKQSEVLALSTELSARFGEKIEGFRAFVHLSELYGAETREWTYVRKDGATLPVALTVTALRDDNDQLTGYLGIARDISSQKKFEFDLLQAGMAKSQFLANMSHEIRTPLNAVLGMLQLLRKTSLSERQEDYVIKAHQASQLLLGLLNDVLDLSKIEAGKLQLESHSFSLEDLLRELGSILSANQGRKDVEIIYDIDSNVPTHMVGDPLRLQQVLINLAGNALKFTEHGQIIVKIKLIEFQPMPSCLSFSVQDTGIGIALEQQKRIFEGFTQAEASTSRKFGGTGLGLTISKRLIELMGGVLSLESEVGKGSTFKFELPFYASYPSDYLVPRPNSWPQQNCLNVLVVDDNTFSRRVLSGLIESMGWRAVEAEGGKTAIDLVQQASLSDAPFDVVLMDWLMPDIDGVTAIQHIRQSVTSLKVAPIIIMVTAYAREMLTEVSTAAIPPATRILNKPVTPIQLFETIQDVCISNHDSSVDRPTNSQRLLGMKLLVIEDNPLNRLVAYELLTHEGAVVQLAEGGISGIQMATEEDNQLDVIMMDVQMPDLDGLEATRQIRMHPSGMDIPIVAMTANVSPAEQAICLEAGMNAHISKPIDMDNVVAVLRTVISNKRHSTKLLIENEKQHFDADEVEQLSVALRRFNGNLSLYNMTLQNFPAEMNRLQDQLLTHAQSRNRLQMTAALHAMKGVAGLIGALGLMKTVGMYEQRIRKGEELDVLMMEGMLEQISELSSRSLSILTMHLEVTEMTVEALPTSRQDHSL